MNKKIKFIVIFIGIIIGLMSIFPFPVSAINQGGSCAGTDGTQYCENATVWQCYDKKWEHTDSCGSGLCTPDNKRCAEEGEEAESVISGTYFVPKKADSGIIPNYGTTGFKFENKSVGDIFSGLLPYLYVIAGLILLVMLVTGGLGLMTAAGNPDKMKAGYGKISNALIGFLIIFISYFVVQLVETILGIKIL